MSKKYINREELRQNFIEYLHNLIPCDNPEYIEMTLKNDYELAENQEFPDPYAVTYIVEKYIGIVEIDGVEYVQRECHINLAALYFAWMENGFGTVVEISQLVTREQPKFKYFKYYRKDDIDGMSYINTRQLFEIIED